MSPVQAVFFLAVVLFAVCVFVGAGDRWYRARDRRAHENLERRSTGRELLDLFDQDRDQQIRRDLAPRPSGVHINRGPRS